MNRLPRGIMAAGVSTLTEPWARLRDSWMGTPVQMPHNAAEEPNA